jgi:OOP family OmpA-OmpF porin
MIGASVGLMRRKQQVIMQHKLSLALVLVIIGLLITAPTVHANTYAGISGGITNANYNSNDLVNDLPNYTLANVSVDDKDKGWKIFSGYQFTPNLAVEASYVDLGEINSEFNATILPDTLQTLLGDAADIHPYMATGFTVAALISVDISQSGSVFGKVGLFNWDAEGNVEETASGQSVKFDDSGNDLVYGLGVKFDMNRQWSLLAEWEMYNADRNDIQFYSIGVKYHF